MESENEIMLWIVFHSLLWCTYHHHILFLVFTQITKLN